jgi:hypothetical protein
MAADDLICFRQPAMPAPGNRSVLAGSGETPSATLVPVGNSVTSTVLRPAASIESANATH